ncbi:site-specific integrase [Nonomuraea turkmeniaca]|uniref:Site-specific integrase n=1 Tax=Nonomuraea turkmeniaca TaxID=103838 RepID=A0A5S4FE87_9ACTN|nr:tyrosine-type recombinase/integrase [Nonomuraea turkmeniaca]TMR17008.1 site-specific integrase [Nonomuraea turkmeniaca]
MTERRSRGDGGLHWDENRQRWIASVTVGYTPAGKRIVRKASGKTKTEAKAKLKEIIRDHDDGLASGPANYTVAEAVTSWLAYGLHGRNPNTVTNYRTLCEKHIIPDLGARKLRELSAEDVDRWLVGKAKVLAARTVRLLHSCLNRAVKFAQARDKVKRNVVGLCEIPEGKEGRPSKSLTLDQATALLDAAENTRFYAYVVLSLLIGARTEELRALIWKEVDLVGDPDKDIPPWIAVWRSVREGGDTKTKRSRRSLALPKRCVEALKAHRLQQRQDKKKAGDGWKDHGLVFASLVGTPLDAHNVRRAFRKIVKDAGMPAYYWTPREMRHSFVSLLSDSGVPLEDIARLVGHSGTAVTEAVYRKQIRSVLLQGAAAMDDLFAR